jgi:UDP-3-O-[3-hydroxymyristoyl] glucosamine N-acyltransferase
MIIANTKPICIIGYQESSMTHEFVNEISKTHACTVLEPDDFLTLSDRSSNQYIMTSWQDFENRSMIASLLDVENLDLITVIHDSVVLGRTPACVIEPGCFIFPFCHVAVGAVIGRHCIIGSHSMIGHYSQLGDQCVLRPGVIVNGKSTIGNNCVLNTRSTVTDGAKICDHVTMLGFTNVYRDIMVPGRYIGTSAKLVGRSK